MKRVCLFPVRHHSPAAAVALRAIALEFRPTAILIEGPSDFQPRLAELFLPHKLPIAIYSFFRDAAGNRRGAFYPFCDYSPEWQALKLAVELQAAPWFIDLPWKTICRLEEEEQRSGSEEKGPILPGGGAQSQRYADSQLRRSAYVSRLCGELGVDDFDALWDELFEIDPDLSPREYVRRASLFCEHCRFFDRVAPIDLAREEFMARKIREAVKEFSGGILVVTGGYHTSGLKALLASSTDEVPKEFRQEKSPTNPAPDTGSPLVQKGGGDEGIALTPYSDARLDGLKGYEAGMPGPGFYASVWKDRAAGRSFDHRKVVCQVIVALRARNQLVSSADLIAAETACQALAAIRRHSRVWRRDIIDGLRGALIKDEVALGMTHPLIQAVIKVFRGDTIGRLAEGTPTPPLVCDIQAVLKKLGLEPTNSLRRIDLNLADSGDRTKSRVLHQLGLLRIPGFNLAGGTDMLARLDLADVREQWEITWSPEFVSSGIEASRYGPTLREAAAAVVEELADNIGNDPERAVALLVDAALAGLGILAGALKDRVERIVRAGGDFLGLSAGLGHLLYLFSYDTILEFEGKESLGELLAESFRRTLFLLEQVGTIVGKDHEILKAFQTMVSVFERCGTTLGIKPEEISAVFSRVRSDRSALLLIRGAAAGGLWSLHLADKESILRDFRLLSDPLHLGDFLTGLFALARESVQQEPELLKALDTRVMEFKNDEFLEAVPALRLAFTFFTPREKHHLAIQVLALESESARPDHRLPTSSSEVSSLSVGPEEIARALTFENLLLETARRFGIKGGTP